MLSMHSAECTQSLESRIISPSNATWWRGRAKYGKLTGGTELPIKLESKQSKTLICIFLMHDQADWFK